MRHRAVGWTKVGQSAHGRSLSAGWAVEACGTRVRCTTEGRAVRAGRARHRKEVAGRAIEATGTGLRETGIGATVKAQRTRLGHRTQRRARVAHRTGQRDGRAGWAVGVFETSHWRTCIDGACIACRALQRHAALCGAVGASGTRALGCIAALAQPACAAALWFGAVAACCREVQTAGSWRGDGHSRAVEARGTGQTLRKIRGTRGIVEVARRAGQGGGRAQRTVVVQRAWDVQVQLAILACGALGAVVCRIKTSCCAICTGRAANRCDALGAKVAQRTGGRDCRAAGAGSAGRADAAIGHVRASR